MKILAAGLPAALISQRITAGPSQDSYFLITDNPRSAVAAMLSTSAIDRATVRIDTRAIAPAAQDLTIIRNGRVVDPGRTANLDPRLKQLVVDLRSRRSPGTALVSVEPRAESSSSHVVFEYDGRIVDTVRRDRAFENITVRGAQGDTVFSLSDGQLTVVRSSCRHELCMRSGAVRSGRIICAPNRVVATLGHSGSALDAITG
ncbi:MAG: hypothetical protein HKN37_03635 [Rhodothermales bacterium]|nr:hypothetical protein [Rhodothermales bacterium]